MTTKRLDQLTAHPKSTANPLALSSDLVLRDAALASDNTRKVSLADIRGKRCLNVMDFGAKFDNSTDDTAAIQAAIDAANSFYSDGGALVQFPTATARITATLNYKVGAYLWSPLNCRILWNGSAGGTMIDATNFNNGLIDGFWFGVGSAVPGYGINIGTNGPDWNAVIRNCYFNRFSGNAIRASSGWLNFSLRHIRFDGIDGYCIRLVSTGGMDGSSFSLDYFTVDNVGSTSWPGFLQVDNTANAANCGVVEISNARLEVNAVPANPCSLVTVTMLNPGNASPVSLLIRNLYIDSLGHDASLVGIRADGNNSDAPCNYVVQNCWFGSTTLISGWDVHYGTHTSGYIPFAAGGGGDSSHNRPCSIMNSELALHFPDFTGYKDGGPPTFSIWRSASSARSMVIDQNGGIYRGDGGSAPSCMFLHGTSSPEGAVTAGVGSLYQRRDGGAGTSLYIKESGSGNTGWKALVGV